MDTYKMWIGGEWVAAGSGKTYDVVNPATEEVFTKVALGDASDVDKAVKAARKALPVWSGKSQDERTRVLNEMARVMRERLPELAELDCTDHGTPIKMAYGMVGGGAPQLEWAAQATRAIMGEYIPTGRPTLFYLRPEPVGVCSLIIPWNGPLNMAITKAAQALAVGNTVVIKPPSIDSTTTLKWAEIIQKVDLPPGTINIVTGPGGTVGEAMASHPDVDLVSFTGSCETGKRIMALASETVKRVSLELGGKNPFILLKDAPLDMAINKPPCARR
jgi:acyl-CoA reductase-like NAD-dependent aldehyde dehydrogenase